MAENTPNTPEAPAPPKPAEAAKVQPKKETVRISLPPKPTAAPTIKIPTPAAPRAPSRRAAASSATGITMLDNGLAVAAAVLGLAALVSVFLLLRMLQFQ